MATYAIGDVQGCFSALQKLVKLIEFDPTIDRLWFVGDLVNRGPDSLSVLRYIKNLKDAAVTVLGNHDLHLLAVWSGVAKLHPKDTLADVLDAPDCDELMTWLRHRPMIYCERRFLMVHAGLLPRWTSKRALKLAGEIETALQSDEFREWLPHIYFRTASAEWSRDLSRQDRLSLAANVMTRVRMCSRKGVPEFSFKGPPEKAPKGYVPWFAVPKQETRKETIVFGHWSALGIHVEDQFWGLDAGCVWGQKLAAIRLEDQKLFQTSCTRR